ncbi:MAG TPA: PAS domain-containing protein, partial [Elusimicrobiales bacterium]|nr:PAS domain-containing protein [Elusimicrobiales bacterium]
VDRAFNVQYANPAALGYLRKKASEVIGRPLASLFPPQVSQRQRQGLDAAFSGGRPQFVECRLGSGREINYQETHLVPIGSPSGAVESVLVILRDTTERRRLLEKFVQAQKMDSVGRLASGVVHDFNNILLVIHGYAEFLQGRLPRHDPGQKEVSGILSTVEHAAALTRQLSAFSRGQVLSRRVVDLNSVMLETEVMLRRLMGDQIRIVIRPSPVPCPVKVDPVQIEQVIMNMAVNARDAMPEGGTLSMEAGVAPAGRSGFRPDAPNGRIACIKISDTGQGMTEEVKSRIFEPFFTTKERGKGAGLGLSIAYGIVTQSGGEIEVESSPGAGAVFRVCFPCEEGAVVRGNGEESPAQPSGGRETILVVDDNAQALDLTARYLR